MLKEYHHEERPISSIRVVQAFFDKSKSPDKFNKSSSKCLAIVGQGIVIQFQEFHDLEIYDTVYKVNNKAKIKQWQQGTAWLDYHEENL